MSENKLPDARRYRPWLKSHLKAAFLFVGGPILLLFAAGVFMAGNRSCNHPQVGTGLHITALQQAFGNFYTEYGHLPDPRAFPTSGDGIFDTRDQEGARLLMILRGAETEAPFVNPRGINFLALPRGKDRKNGLGEETPPRLYDQWGGGYKIVVDYDGDGQLIAPPDSGKRNVPGGAKVAIYSKGKDGAGDRSSIRSW